MFDLIVCGAGPGGCICAKKASELGLKVLLLDLKKKSSIGDKVCGDACDKQEFEHLGIDEPKGDELDNSIAGARLYAPNPDIHMNLTVEGNYGFMINRLEFGQRILDEALDAGADLRDESLVVGPLISDKQVKGVIIKNKSKVSETIEGKIVVDGTGVASAIRKKVKSPYIENYIDDKDQIVCYREILKVEDYKYRKDFIHIFLSREKAPGGYWWYFPKGNNTINIGVGVFKHPDYSVKYYYNNYIRPIAGKVSKIIDSAGGIVPVRRPIWSLVENGVMMIGDAACVVNPLHGGGIAPAMRGGYYAAEVAANALEKDDVSKNGLWEYNLKYLPEQGAEFAGLDVFRIALQRFSPQELNYGLKQRLFTEKDVMDYAEGKGINIGLNLQTLGKLFRGIFMPELLLNLYYLNNQVKKIKSLYENYPRTPELKALKDWKSKVLKIYDDVDRLIK
ncbi:MAG: geranylgeranyl reductase family protein [Candidatus Lokiarchaeota archaeon]|nr:geranylgeranyl reductase family protein [Candidatus Lokiarchaeota archaeon]